MANVTAAAAVGMPTEAVAGRLLLTRLRGGEGGVRRRPATRLETPERFGVPLVGGRSIGNQGFHVRGFTDDVLDFRAAARGLEVRSKPANTDGWFSANFRLNLDKQRLLSGTLSLTPTGRRTSARPDTGLRQESPFRRRRS